MISDRKTNDKELSKKRLQSRKRLQSMCVQNACLRYDAPSWCLLPGALLHETSHIEASSHMQCPWWGLSDGSSTRGLLRVPPLLVVFATLHGHLPTLKIAFIFVHKMTIKFIVKGFLNRCLFRNALCQFEQTGACRIFFA